MLAGLIAAIPMALIGITSLISASREQAIDFGEKSAYYNSEIINTWLKEKGNALTNLENQLANLNDENEMRMLLRGYSNANSDFISVFIGYEDNELFDAYGWIPEDNYVVRERPWYVKAFNQDKLVTTAVYIDENKNKNVTAIATEFNFGERRGVLAANIYVDYIVDKIDDIKYGNSGYAVLLDDANKMISGPDNDENLELFNSIIKQLEKKKIVLDESKTFELKIDNITYLAAYSNIQGFDWNLFLIAPLSDFMEPAYAMINNIIYIMIATFVLIFFIGYYLSSSMSRPILKMVKGVSDIAGGDFDNEINIDAKDEIGNLSNEINKMRINLKEIFNSIKYESKIISMNSENLSNHLKDTYTGTYRFMSMLSHDIKTPITLIKGYSKALEMGILKEEKEKEYIERIIYRSDQIEKIVADVLDNTYESNNLKINLKKVTCEDFINTVIYNSETYVVNQKRKFEKNINFSDFDETDVIYVDLIKMQRVVNNILSNAVKFSEENSIIELEIKKYDGRIFTCFKDQGEGIKKEEKEKIFNMFYKSNDSKKGYGLGLYINKAIIEAHDGEVYFDSIFNIGTTSGFYLKIGE
jgi:signal transduction histidine kinase